MGLGKVDTSVLEYGVAFITLYVLVVFILVLMQNFSEVSRAPKPPRKLPSLTVLIPAFNEQETIAKCIESVLDAAYPKKLLEVIVINDGSTDSTLQIAKRYQKNGVKVIDKKNSGKADSLNAGLKIAKGEYVATLDSDSFIDKDAFKQMLGHFESKDVAAVTSVLRVYEPRNILQEFQKVEYLYMVFTRKLLSFMDSVTVTPGPMSLFRREVFRKVGDFDATCMLEDQEMAFRLQKNNYRIASSMSATVSTVVPSDLKGLLRQRIRWNRGGLRNLIKHYYLVSPKYGDFGLFTIPVAMISIVMIFLLFSLAVFFTLTSSLFSDLMDYGPDILFFSISGVQVLAAFILILTFVWLLYGFALFRKENVSLKSILVYLLVYTPLMMFFWLAAAFKEVRHEALKW